jgi:hypothetical protein
MPKRMQGMVPQAGQVVGCWFPDQQSPETRGAKFRPACVVASNSHMLEDHPKIGLVYGTGQATTSKSGPALQAHEFELEKADGGNTLPEQTRFDCSRFVWLPFTEEWFLPPQGPGNMVAGFGKVPEARKPGIRAALEAGKAKMKPVPTKPAVVVKPAGVATAKTLSLPKKVATDAPKPIPPTDA